MGAVVAVCVWLSAPMWLTVGLPVLITVGMIAGWVWQDVLKPAEAAELE